jgi:serine/threonine protein kinase
VLEGTPSLCSLQCRHVQDMRFANTSNAARPDILSRSGQASPSCVCHGLRNPAAVTALIQACHGAACRQIEREMNVQALMDHPHVLKLYGAFEDDTFIYMVQQLANKGDIYKTYLAQRVRVSEADLVRTIIQPLLQAIEHTHQRGIIHRCGRAAYTPQACTLFAESWDYTFDALAT